VAALFKERIIDFGPSKAMTLSGAFWTTSTIDTDSGACEDANKLAGATS
jgi:hypothetical protein